MTPVTITLSKITAQLVRESKDEELSKNLDYGSGTQPLRTPSSKVIGKVRLWHDDGDTPQHVGYISSILLRPTGILIRYRDKLKE